MFQILPHLVGGKFKHSQVDREDQARDIGNALHLLCLARIAACKVYLRQPVQPCPSSVCSAYPQITVLPGLNMMPNLNRYFTDGLHPTDERCGHYSISLIKSLLNNGVKS